MVVGGLFLSWTRPSKDQQKACTAVACGFNYDPQFLGLSRNGGVPDDENPRRLLADHGFFVNRSRVLLGSGADTFRRAKSALLSWRHFGLDWAFVDESTPVEEGVKFCACVKEFVPWVMMPLQVAYVASNGMLEGRSEAASGGGATEVASRPRGKASFRFGSGTLRGHLLAGEEQFSVDWDENDQVWYEIFSFSKPAHFLSVIGYPYVRLRQKYFAEQSTNAVLKHIAEQQQLKR